MKKINHTMKEMPDLEMPYGKCIKYGPKVLSDAELLAIIIKTGTKNKTSYELALEILCKNDIYKGLLGLYHLSINDLMQIKGIGKIKAIQILCILELAIRITKERKNTNLIIKNPNDVANYFMGELRILETEHVYAVFMDTAGNILKYQVIFKGTINSSTANPREILRMALKYDAASLIIMHNHPSGDPSPSKEDLLFTKTMKKACDLIGIPLKDHIIFGDNKYYSLCEKGYL